MKKCTKCGETKALSEFSADKSKPDGLRAYCKSCVKAASNAYYETNRGKVLEQKKAHYEANRDKVKAHYEANRDKVKARQKAYREVNRDKVRARKKAYREGYWAKHGVAPNTSRRRRDPQARLADILRSRLRDALKGKSKKGSAVRDLGMPIDAFLVYLNLDAIDKYGIPYTGNEQLFHIDHIKPLVSFDLQDPEQLRIAVRWDNLQVLTVKENLAKGQSFVSPQLLEDGPKVHTGQGLNILCHRGEFHEPNGAGAELGHGEPAGHQALQSKA